MVICLRGVAIDVEDVASAAAEGDGVVGEEAGAVEGAENGSGRVEAPGRWVVDFKMNVATSRITAVVMRPLTRRAATG